MDAEAMRRGLRVGAALLFACTLPALAQQDTVQRAIGAVEQGQRAAAQSQERIDRLDTQTREMLERYRAAIWQAQQLEVYSEQIEELVESQRGDREALQRQIDEMERVERDLLPLMLRMIDSLESFIELDLPFLPEERRRRVAELRRQMGDADVGTADKFRRILEAYRIEVEYGNVLGAERVEVDGRLMDQLRVGRAGLFAIALDAEDALRWDAQAKQWQSLQGRYIPALREALRIARETAAASLLVLPMPIATAADGDMQ